MRIIASLALVACLSACTDTQVQHWFGLEVDQRREIVEHVIRSAAEEFDVDPVVMLNLAQCESGMRPEAKNPKSSAAGLYQYLDTTWNTGREPARERLYNRGLAPAPYEPADVFDPVAAARTTASVIAEGGWWWECRRRG